MKIYNYIFIITLIIINLINKNHAYNIQLRLYKTNNCTKDDLNENTVAIFSSTKCSDFGLVNETTPDGSKGSIYYHYSLVSANDCKLALEGKPTHYLLKVDDVDVKVCQYQTTTYYHKYEVNQNSSPKVQMGMCNVITAFDDECNYVKIRSFHNGSCFFENLNEYRKYYCDGDRYYTYTCGLDKTCSNCEPIKIDDNLSYYNKCTGLDVNSDQYNQYLNYYHPAPTHNFYNDDNNHFNTSIKISTNLSLLVLFNIIYITLFLIIIF